MAMNDYQFGKQRISALGIPQSVRAIPNIDELVQQRAQYDAGKLSSAMNISNQNRATEFDINMAEREAAFAKREYPWAVAATIGGIGMEGLGAWKAKKNEEAAMLREERTDADREELAQMMKMYSPSVLAIMSKFIDEQEEILKRRLPPLRHYESVGNYSIPEY